MTMIKLMRLRYLMLVCLMFLFIGCAQAKVNYDKLTPDQKAALVLDGIQDQIDIWHDAGVTFVNANPKYTADWVNRVNPLFDVANKLVADAITYKKSPSVIYSEVSPTVVKAVAALQAWGVKIQD